MTKKDAKREVARLVGRLEDMKPREFKRYDEENTKKDFILPLFRALGWEVEDRREVTAEDRVSRRRVDYAFRVDGRIAFFLEAKPVKADLDNPDYARQAIGYAWTKGVTWAVLTDFEELKIFNAEWKERDLRKNVVKEIPYSEYGDRFEELWFLSKPAMKAGLLDAEAEKWGKKTRKKPVGDQLFEDLVRWRWELRRHLLPYNKDYTAGQIDEAVHRILDRLIFIRTAEDRGIEQERLLLALVREWQEGGRKEDLIQLLKGVFRDFDEGYDSALFEPHFSEDLESESKPFEDTILGLYRTPDKISEYDFNAIDADVLGGIYEQYLGYAQGLAEEEAAAKRARRKKQGIFYTPQFVVDYIVQNTVGRLLEERTHHEIRNLRILDPACGSGSFLIAAFDALDNYHQGLTGDVASGFSPTKQAGYSGEIFDLSRRLQVLTQNLYGVDLDPQAVEIAQLNLLLKTLTRRERLPNLNPNIRRGNSLISGTPEELSEHFGEAWKEKHPFNWEEEFPKIMAEGGFDVVIGNPPYVRAENMPKDERRYWQESGSFDVIYGRFDVYILFVERGIKLLRPGGRLGFIVPYAVLNQNYGKRLRRLILDNYCIESIVDLSKYRAFEEAAVATCIVALRREPDEAIRRKYKIKVIRQQSYDQGIVESKGASYFIPQNLFGTTLDNMFRLEFTRETVRVIRKMESGDLRAGDLCYVITGVVAHHSASGASKDRLIHPERASAASRPYIEAKEMSYGRYEPVLPTRFIEYLPDEMHRPKFPELFENTKLLIQDIIGASGLIATLDDSDIYTNHSFNCCVKKDALVRVDRPLGITKEAAESASPYDLKYILGILNSRLMTFYFRSALGGDMHTSPRNVRSLPIRRIDFDDPEDLKRHDRLVALVDRMLDLHERLADAPEGSSERTRLERRIVRTDQQIDDLVYELYDITDKERKIVGGES